MGCLLLPTPRQFNRRLLRNIAKEQGMSKKTAKKDDVHQEPLLPGIESNLTQREQLAMISRIPAHELHDELLVTNYQPDRAIREAVLAQQEDWKLEADGLSYAASHQLLVYLGE